MNRQTNLMLISVILFGFILTAGCSDDNDLIPPEIIDQPPQFITPDFLMAGLKDIYEEMDSENFENHLHADYRMVLRQETFDAWEGSDNPFNELFVDKTSQVEIHRRMFENFEGVDPAGIALPPIVSISVDVMDRDGTWEAVEESEEYFGGRSAYKAEYHLQIYFATLGNHLFEVDQIVFFYVIQGTDGLWKMLGVKPILNIQANPILGTEEMTYCGMLSLYK